MVLRPIMISSNQEKRRLVDQTALRMADRGYRFPQWDQLVNEMERYEATEQTSPNGNTFVRYSAPSGFLRRRGHERSPRNRSSPASASSRITFTHDATASGWHLGDTWRTGCVTARCNGQVSLLPHGATTFHSNCTRVRQAHPHSPPHCPAHTTGPRLPRFSSSPNGHPLNKNGLGLCRYRQKSIFMSTETRRNGHATRFKAPTSTPTARRALSNICSGIKRATPETVLTHSPGIRSASFLISACSSRRHNANLV
jgi:hypothetical protein